MLATFPVQSTHPNNFEGNLEAYDSFARDMNLQSRKNKISCLPRHWLLLTICGWKCQKRTESYAEPTNAESADKSSEPTMWSGANFMQNHQSSGMDLTQIEWLPARKLLALHNDTKEGRLTTHKWQAFRTVLMMLYVKYGSICRIDFPRLWFQGFDIQAYMLFQAKDKRQNLSIIKSEESHMRIVEVLDTYRIGWRVDFTSLLIHRYAWRLDAGLAHSWLAPQQESRDRASCCTQQIWEPS